MAIGEGVLAVQAGTYRWLSASDRLKPGHAARVEAFGSRLRHVLKERLLNDDQDPLP